MAIATPFSAALRGTEGVMGYSMQNARPMTRRRPVKVARGLQCHAPHPMAVTVIASALITTLLLATAAAWGASSGSSPKREPIAARQFRMSGPHLLTPGYRALLSVATARDLQPFRAHGGSTALEGLRILAAPRPLKRG